ncbi:MULTISPECIES: hypothetical protein [unclassified Pseudomonas]|uniref:hypothetical protein n=1 Tax=unclassified Pseudomonas TaxID=196821 RepID=UPI000C88D1C3|nr:MULTISPECIES: hypothetical protein [unclassified Pseudomonas]PMZ92743.1 hypothetical protein C1X61_02375 [Pseudomonas sp. FW215-T2]PNA16685.1 hypothetical protein C1X62_00950 [Pseudomonas sp. FW215-R3]PNB39588.1 hypothetical protein C1X63_01410 [Pseudomonas sp. FW305-131]
MIVNLVKVSLLAGALLLSACSGVSAHRDFSADSVQPAGFGPGPTSSNPDKMNFHGSALGNSFGEYGSGLLHDD